VDEYDPTLADPSAGALDLPSDVKTVAYFLQGGGTVTSSAALDSTGTTLSIAVDTSQSGLVRRQLDRAVTQWASNNGNLASLSTGGDVIAPKVQSLEFAYFDGSEWLLEWDSGEAGRVPLAVEIVIGIASPQAVRQVTTSTGTSTVADGTELNYYSLIVYLPAGEIVDEGGTESGASGESMGSAASEEPQL
jgi:hypothetical protein